MAIADERATYLGTTEGEAPDDQELLASLAMAGWRVESFEGEVLQQSRFRPVHRYRVRYTNDVGSASVTRIFIGKADYRDGGASTYAFMRRLQAAGFGTGGEEAIPEPIAYLDRLSLLVQTEAPGRCLYEWIAHPETGLAPARSAGRWLARLHTTVLSSPDGRLPTGFEEHKLAGYRRGLADALPDHAAHLGDLTRRTLRALQEVAHVAPVPTHGDYQPKNIYVDGSRVTVIDWDRAALAHPARDLGHFVGQCLTMAYSKTGTFSRVEAWNEAFLDGYTGVSPSGWQAGLAPYVARTLLEVLYYKLVVKPVRDPSFVPIWLDALDDILIAGV